MAPNTRSRKARANQDPPLPDPTMVSYQQMLREEHQANMAAIHQMTQVMMTQTKDGVNEMGKGKE